MIYVYWMAAYCVCVICVALIVKYNFQEAKLWQKALMVILSPLVLAAMAVILLCILPGHIKKNGFHSILPRRKGKAYPLDAEDFEFWPKDTILSGDGKMSIGEFNQKFGKNLSLDDVYGHGYVAALTPEEVFECKSILPSKYGLEPNMPDSAYKNAAIALAFGLSSGDFKGFDALLSPNADLVVFDKEERNGRTEVVKYFADWVDRARRGGSVTRLMPSGV